MSQDDLIEQVKQVLEGNMREIVGTVGIRELVQDRKGVATKVQENVIPDMGKLGIELVNFNIQNFSDRNNVIENLGIDNISQISKEAAIAKANAERDVSIARAKAQGKKIASFVNQRFYNEQLKLLNDNSGELTYYNVKNTFNPNARNAYKEEAIQIAKIIKDNKYQDVGIITPFVNQAEMINNLLIRMGRDDIKAGTVHTLQGSEKSVIIMSAALSPRTGKKTMAWIKDNHELINVAVTRAKERFIFVGDKEAIDKLSGEEKNDIKVLSDYVYKNGEIIVPKSDAIISYDFSNDSKNEKDFFDTIQPYFNRRGTKFRVSRNVRFN